MFRVLGNHFRPRLQNCLAPMLVNSATAALQGADEPQPDFDLVKNSMRALNAVKSQFGGVTSSVDPDVLIVDTVFLSDDHTSNFDPIVVDSGASTSLCYEETDFGGTKLDALRTVLHLQDRVSCTDDDFCLSCNWNPPSEGEDEDRTARQAIRLDTFNTSDEPACIKSSPTTNRISSSRHSCTNTHNNIWL